MRGRGGTGIGRTGKPRPVGGYGGVNPEKPHGGSLPGSGYISPEGIDTSNREFAARRTGVKLEEHTPKLDEFGRRQAKGPKEKMLRAYARDTGRIVKAQVTRHVERYMMTGELPDAPILCQVIEGIVGKLIAADPALVKTMLDRMEGAVPKPVMIGELSNEQLLELLAVGEDLDGGDDSEPSGEDS